MAFSDVAGRLNKNLRRAHGSPHGGVDTLRKAKASSKCELKGGEHLKDSACHAASSRRWSNSHTREHCREEVLARVPRNRLSATYQAQAGNKRSSRDVSL
jgi:hypothetical protein